MATITKEIEVSKELTELGEGVAGFVAATRQALADGWQVGQDLPVVMAAALQHLAPAVQGVEKIESEIKEDPVASGMAAMYTGQLLLKQFVK